MESGCWTVMIFTLVSRNFEYTLLNFNPAWLCFLKVEFYLLIKKGFGKLDQNLRMERKKQQQQQQQKTRKSKTTTTKN